MATITVRKLDANHDPICGQGQANFISDREAVAQIVLTRLLLFEGEWWADQLDGTPFWQSILGASGSESDIRNVTQLITQRILGTPYVLSITGLQTSFDSTSRTYNFYCVVNTQFGAIAVSNIPVPSTQSLS